MTNSHSHKQFWFSAEYSVQKKSRTHYRHVDVWITAPIQGKQWSASIQFGK